ncbi:MAG: ABC transporter substrate-binding protein [Spirochaetota bacterium]
MKHYLMIGISVLLLTAALFFIMRPPEHTENKLEIFSWWTATGEEEALNELYKLYMQQNPKVKIINAAVVGGMGSKARSVLETRMAGGNPPDSFQVLAGPSLLSRWIKPGYLQDLSFIYERHNLIEQFPEELLQKLSYRGGIYAIPVNIHRENVLWYNKSIFERCGLDPPRTPEELHFVVTQLAAVGITPLSVGDKNHWPALHLFESILVSQLETEEYNGLWRGTTPWNSDKIKSSLEQFRFLFEFVNSDHAALTWDEGVQYMVDGKCAMTVMGDFAEGYLKAKGLEPNKQFGWVSFPGSQDVFVMNSDTFALPKKAVHRENAIKWLEMIGSKAAQDAFNPEKGSIPARHDSRQDMDSYNAYQQSAARAFHTREIVGSVTHGTVAPDQWRNELYRIIDTFIVDKNIEKAVNELQRASRPQCIEGKG